MADAHPPTQRYDAGTPPANSIPLRLRHRADPGTGFLLTQPPAPNLALFARRHTPRYAKSSSPTRSRPASTSRSAPSSGGKLLQLTPRRPRTRELLTAGKTPRSRRCSWSSGTATPATRPRRSTRWTSTRPATVSTSSSSRSPTGRCPPSRSRSQLLRLRLRPPPLLAHRLRHRRGLTKLTKRRA